MSQIDTRTCALRLIADRRAVACPHERCAFREPGGAVGEGQCLVERLGVDVRGPDLAAYLLDVRGRLEPARDLSAAEVAHREFARGLGRE